MNGRGGKRLGLGNGSAAMLGVATPFCSCSAVPLFIGLYMIIGLTIAIIAGIVIGRIPNVERGVEDFVWQVSVGQAAETSARPSWHERFQTGWQGTREIVSKVWLYVVIGIAIGAAIHGFVPEDALADILGKGAWWSVPAGEILGIPLYSNAAGIIPVVHALMEKGAALGTTLAFMMIVVALSLPKMIILRRVLKPRLIALFVVGVGIIITGYLFNIVI